MSVDWTKPIEYRFHGRVYPARLIGNVNGERSFVVAYVVDGEHEAISRFRENGSFFENDRERYIFNVEPPKKKITVYVDIFKDLDGHLYSLSAVDQNPSPNRPNKLVSHSFELEVSVAS